MAAQKINVDQGDVYAFIVRNESLDLRDYDIKCDVRPDFASEAALQDDDPLFSVSVGSGIVLGAVESGAVKQAVVTWSPAMTVLLENQANVKSVLYRADVKISHKTNPDDVRRPVRIDITVTPMVTP